jgi:hypothetical protein
MTEQEHLEHFWDNIAYGGLPLAKETVSKIVSMVADLDQIADTRDLIPLLVSEG